MPDRAFAIYDEPAKALVFHGHAGETLSIPYVGAPKDGHEAAATISRFFAVREFAKSVNDAAACARCFERADVCRSKATRVFVVCCADCSHAHLQEFVKWGRAQNVKTETPTEAGHA